MTSLLALSIKVLESYLHSSTTKSLEATTHIDLRTQILDNWRYLYPFHTNVSVIVLTLEGRLWGHRYQAIITENRIQDGKIFMATDPKDNVELALHALLDATGDKINKMFINPIIVVTYRDCLYEAVLTSEDYSHNRVLMSSGNYAHVEGSLRELLHMTCEMVEGKLRSKRNATGQYSLW
ncbi:hypothetical protein KCU99_g4269, partial [Aureobasidium melanogenum]